MNQGKAVPKSGEGYKNAQNPMIMAANAESPTHSGHSSLHSIGSLCSQHSMQSIVRIEEALDRAAARARALDGFDMPIENEAQRHASDVQALMQAGCSAACAKFARFEVKAMSAGKSPPAAAGGAAAQQAAATSDPFARVEVKAMSAGKSPPAAAGGEAAQQAAATSDPTCLPDYVLSSVAHSKFLHMKERARRCEERTVPCAAATAEGTDSGSQKRSLPSAKRTRRGETCAGLDERDEHSGAGKGASSECASPSKRARHQPPSP